MNGIALALCGWFALTQALRVFKKTQAVTALEQAVGFAWLITGIAACGGAVKLLGGF